MNRQLIALLAVALLAAAGGYFAAMQMGPGRGAAALGENPEQDLQVGAIRPDFTHKDLDGRPVSAAEFDGGVLLVNFWATWCKPCVEEMPMLSRLQDDLAGQGFRVVGIALDEPGRAAEFAAEMELSYPVLVGEADVVITNRRYGNASGMLPYSVLVDAQGVVRWTSLGALEASELERRVRGLLPTGQ